MGGPSPFLNFFTDMNAYTEWAEFALKPGASEASLLAASSEMQRQFLDQQAGFMARDTVRLAPGRYLDWVVWQSAQAARDAMRLASSSPACKAYFALMTVDNPPRLAERLSHHERPRWGGMEFSSFRLRSGTATSTLLAAAHDMVEGLYQGAPGFVEHAILRNEQGDHADVVLADDAASAAALCARWGQGPDITDFAPPCRSYLSLIEPGSTHLAFWQRLK